MIEMKGECIVGVGLGRLATGDVIEIEVKYLKYVV
jgi:hypothetical protein